MPRYSPRLPTVLSRYLCEPASYFERLLRMRCLSFLVMDYENLSEMIRTIPKSIMSPILRKFYESDQKKVGYLNDILGYICRKDPLRDDWAGSAQIFPLLIEWNRVDLIGDIMSWCTRSEFLVFSDFLELLQHNYDRRVIKILMPRVCIVGAVTQIAAEFFVWMCNDLRESGYSYTHDCKTYHCPNRG